MKKKSKIPTIIGLIVLVIGTFLGVFILNSRQVFRIGASPEVAPKDIRVSNISDGAVTISWVTDAATTGFVSWGEAANAVTKIEKESESDEKFFTHSISLTGLKAATNYFYKINSEGTETDNNGIPWQVATGPELAANPNSLLISGSILTPSGAPSKRALVYANIGGYLSSTLASDTGNYVFQLSGVRTQDLESYAVIDESQTLVEISAQAGPDGATSAQIFPQSAKPVPAMILGQVYDFRNLPASTTGQAPDASLNLPENSTDESKFAVPEDLTAPAATTVILENVDQGEVITSTQPEFMGKGPAGETLTIKVESENPITATVEIPQDGSWNWSPPTDLAPGAHKITISWIDTSGITRSLTRDFVVQAAEGPAFEATPSQTLAPTGSPTSSPTATPKAATVSASPSAQPVPVTGSLTPTIVLSIMGIAVIAFSFVIWKIAEN